MMGRTTQIAVVWMVCYCSTAPLVAAFDVESRAPRPPAMGGLTSAGLTSAEQQQQQRGVAQPAGVRAEVGKWYARYQGFVSGAAKVSRFINMGCGVWLVVTTPFSLLGSTFGLRPSEVILCGYLCMFGVLMAGIEIPLGALQKMLRAYFFFAFTRIGRAAFVSLVACVAYTIKHVGFVTKAMLIFNAGLNMYILNSQDRRFAQSDAQAMQALSDVSAELRESATGALSFGKYLGISKMFGSSEPAAAPAGGFDPVPPAVGGFDPPVDPQPSWPGGGDA